MSLRRDESFDQIDGFEVLETRIGEVTVQVGTGLPNPADVDLGIVILAPSKFQDVEIDS